jgi:enamine deaminase RidA (YjgF/YER057c/UK114 family)
MKKTSEQPIPQGNYVPAVRHADLIYTSGMTPRKAGKLIYSGKIKVTDSILEYQAAVELATLNALKTAQSCLKESEKIGLILQLNVYLNTEEEQNTRLLTMLQLCWLRNWVQTLQNMPRLLTMLQLCWLRNWVQTALAAGLQLVLPRCHRTHRLKLT